MTKRTHTMGGVIALLATLAVAFAGHAASDGQDAVLRLLLVDGTKTFASTARVGALAGAIRSTGQFDLAVRFSDEMCQFGDPLACVVDLPTDPYDLVIIIPRGLDDGSADSIWVVTTILPWSRAKSWPAIVVVEGMINQVFFGLASAVDPCKDLWPAFAASLYQAQGWLQ